VSASAALAHELAAGWVHTCAIDDNDVTSWGDNYQGQSSVPAGLVSPARPGLHSLSAPISPEHLLIGSGRNSASISYLA
jgi:hypothetical protein